MEIPFQIQFSENEKYFPTSIEYYIKSCHLEDKSGTIIKPNGEITIYDLQNASDTDRLILYENKREGFKNNLNLAPVYRSINEITFNGELFRDHVYLLFYNFNGTSENHDFDCEFVTVRYDKDQNILGMFLSQHGDAVFYKISELEIKNNKYVIYAGNESHANYNRTGSQIRFFWFW